MSKLIGVFGGTFDPVHNGHTQIILNLIKDIPFSEIKVIPNGTPPHRSSVGSVNDRLQMVSLAFQGQDKVTIDDREIKREGFSYAIDTAKEILDEYKEDRLVWIMGSDAFSGIDSWYKWEEFLKLVNILVVTRPHTEINKDSKVWQLVQEIEIDNIASFKGTGKIIIHKINPINISSTQVRKNVSLGKDLDNLVIDEVSDYIDEGKLYT
jgi:nicotinate-nucleotide adenylyltransferase